MENLKQLFPLSESDIKAIGNTRVNRAEGNKQTYWLVGAMLAMCAGVFVYKMNIAIGWALIITGALNTVYYMNNISKKQKGVVDTLLKQWREQAK